MGKYVGNSNVPSGAVFDFAGTVAPVGYLFCDGSAVSRTLYASLFAAIGTAHGYGDNSTTFNLPDYRGAFRRTVCGSGTNDPDKLTRSAMATGGNTGNAVGSIQADSIRAHNHGLASNNTGSGYANVGGTGAGSNGGAFNTTTSSGNETRPVNAYVNTIIKI